MPQTCVLAGLFHIANQEYKLCGDVQSMGWGFH